MDGHAPKLTSIMALTMAAATMAAALLLSGCGRSKDLEGKMREAEKERQARALGALEQLAADYAESLVSTLPAEDAPPVQGQESAMMTWRKEAAEKADLHTRAKETATKMGQTEQSRRLQDGILMFEVIGDFWLGRKMAGPAVKKEWEEGYQDSVKVAAKEGAREQILLPDFQKSLETLGVEEPWKEIAQFEELLPHVMQTYQFRAYFGDAQDTSFSLYWQALFDIPRKTVTDEETGFKFKERYQPYRDRLCDEKLKGKCDVPYEHRDLVVRRRFFETLHERLEAFRKAYPESRLAPIVERFLARVGKERELAVVPEEYPVLPNTLSQIPTSMYTVIIAGRQGVVLETDEPPERKVRRVRELFGPVAGWNLEQTTWRAIRERFKTEMEALREDGGRADLTDELFVHLDKDVPVRLLHELARTFHGLNVKLIDLVARIRSDGTNRMRRIPGSVVDDESREAETMKGEWGEWSCTPLTSLGLFPAVPESARFVLATPDTVYAGTYKKMKKTSLAELVAKGELGGDLSKVTGWVQAEHEKGGKNKLLMIGVLDTMTYAQLHAVIDAVLPKGCDKDVCTDKGLGGKTLAICRSGEDPEAALEPEPTPGEGQPGDPRKPAEPARGDEE